MTEQTVCYGHAKHDVEVRKGLGVEQEVLVVQHPLFWNGDAQRASFRWVEMGAASNSFLP